MEAIVGRNTRVFSSRNLLPGLLAALGLSVAAIYSGYALETLFTTGILCIVFYKSYLWLAFRQFIWNDIHRKDETTSCIVEQRYNHTSVQKGYGKRVADAIGDTKVHFIQFRKTNGPLWGNAIVNAKSKLSYNNRPYDSSNPYTAQYWWDNPDARNVSHQFSKDTAEVYRHNYQRYLFSTPSSKSLKTSPPRLMQEDAEAYPHTYYNISQSKQAYVVDFVGSRYGTNSRCASPPRYYSHEQAMERLGSRCPLKRRLGLEPTWHFLENRIKRPKKLDRSVGRCNWTTMGALPHVRLGSPDRTRLSEKNTSMMTPEPPCLVKAYRWKPSQCLAQMTMPETRGPFGEHLAEEIRKRMINRDEPEFCMSKNKKRKSGLKSWSKLPDSQVTDLQNSRQDVAPVGSLTKSTSMQKQNSKFESPPAQWSLPSAQHKLTTPTHMYRIQREPVTSSVTLGTAMSSTLTSCGYPSSVTSSVRSHDVTSAPTGVSGLFPPNITATSAISVTVTSEVGFSGESPLTSNEIAAELKHLPRTNQSFTRRLQGAYEANLPTNVESIPLSTCGSDKPIVATTSASVRSIVDSGNEHTPKLLVSSDTHELSTCPVIGSIASSSISSNTELADRSLLSSADERGLSVLDTSPADLYLKLPILTASNCFQEINTNQNFKEADVITPSCVTVRDKTLEGPEVEPLVTPTNTAEDIVTVEPYFKKPPLYSVQSETTEFKSHGTGFSALIPSISTPNNVNAPHHAHSSLFQVNTVPPVPCSSSSHTDVSFIVPASPPPVTESVCTDLSSGISSAAAVSSPFNPPSSVSARTVSSLISYPSFDLPENMHASAPNTFASAVTPSPFKLIDSADADAISSVTIYPSFKSPENMHVSAKSLEFAAVCRPFTSPTSSVNPCAIISSSLRQSLDQSKPLKTSAATSLVKPTMTNSPSPLVSADAKPRVSPVSTSKQPQTISDTASETDATRVQRMTISDTSVDMTPVRPKTISDTAVRADVTSMRTKTISDTCAREGVLSMRPKTITDTFARAGESQVRSTKMLDSAARTHDTPVRRQEISDTAVARADVTPVRSKKTLDPDVWANVTLGRQQKISDPGVLANVTSGRPQKISDPGVLADVTTGRPQKISDPGVLADVTIGRQQKISDPGVLANVTTGRPQKIPDPGVLADVTTGRPQKIPDTAAKAVAIPVPPASPNYERLSDGNYTFIIFDLETTGFGAAEIVQLAATCGDRTFNEFVLPDKNIAKGASDVTGITKEDGKLYKDGDEVSFTLIDHCLSQFEHWMHGYDNPVLVAHNCFTFDSYVLTRQLLKWRPSLASKITGFVDTLPLFREVIPGKASYKQETLLEAEDISYDAHCALADVRALDTLIQRKNVDKTLLLKHSRTTEGVLQYTKIREAKYTAKNSLYRLIDTKVLSDSMAKNIVDCGLNYNHLKSAYKNDKKHGIRRILSDEVDGRPRVTKTERIIKAVENYFASLDLQ